MSWQEPLQVLRKRLSDATAGSRPTRKDKAERRWLHLALSRIAAMPDNLNESPGRDGNLQQEFTDLLVEFYECVVCRWFGFVSGFCVLANTRPCHTVGFIITKNAAVMGCLSCRTVRDSRDRGVRVAQRYKDDRKSVFVMHLRAQYEQHVPKGLTRFSVPDYVMNEGNEGISYDPWCRCLNPRLAAHEDDDKQPRGGRRRRRNRIHSTKAQRARARHQHTRHPSRRKAFWKKNQQHFHQVLFCAVGTLCRMSVVLELFGRVLLDPVSLFDIAWHSRIVLTSSSLDRHGASHQ